MIVDTLETKKISIRTRRYSSSDNAIS